MPPSWGSWRRQEQGEPGTRETWGEHEEERPRDRPGPEQKQVLLVLGTANSPQAVPRGSAAVNMAPCHFTLAATVLRSRPRALLARYRQSCGEGKTREGEGRVCVPPKSAFACRSPPDGTDSVAASARGYSAAWWFQCTGTLFALNDWPATRGFLDGPAISALPPSASQPGDSGVL